MIKIIKSLKWLLFTIILIFSYNHSMGQTGGIKLSAGLATVEILGKHVGSMKFVTIIGDTGRIYGGSFDQAQSGFRLEGLFPLDNEELFEIPVGFEMQFFQGREKEPISKVSDIKMRHDANNLTFTLGLNYTFFKFNALSTEAKFYAGFDTRTAILLQGEYNQVSNLVNTDSLDLFAYKTKPTAIRFGGALNLGLNGKLVDPVFVDIRSGIGVMNLLGRDDSRGELFTLGRYIDYIEPKENFLFTFHVVIMLQIRL